jgi:hypothetical protein
MVLRTVVRSLAFALMFLSLSAFAQGTPEPPAQPTYSAVLGVGLEPDARPSGGAGLLAHINGNLFSYTALTVRGVGDEGNPPIYSALQGFLLKLQDTDRLDFYVNGNGGITQDPDTTRADFSAGGIAAYRLFGNVELWGGVLVGDSATEGGIAARYMLGFRLGQ